MTWFLNYVTKNSEAITIYHGSEMVLHMHSNAYFLSELESKVRAVGYHYLRTQSADPNDPPINYPQINGPVHVECITMCTVLASDME